ncbi:hypothetical protein I4U23_021252 [Adineta vaga]|nr:hypothetical protein I4U23_021252 [Adineta vaga]
MLFQSHTVIFLCFIAYAAAQTYTKLDFKDCGSRNVQISRLSITPMPIIQPGEGTVSVSVAATENIKGVIKADLNIIRKVSGIQLPIKCYIVEGEFVGSCSYPDLCGLMKRLIKYEPGQCPENLAQYGIDCECPININKNDIDIEMAVSIPQAPDFASWLSVGDFDVNLKATVANIYACYDIKFSVKPKK